jgi:tetratricopeptide (TPR) repeat protein
LGVVLLGLGIASYFLNRGDRARAHDRPQRVAVLPFENQSGDEALDGIEQLAAVTTSRQLQTLPRVSVFLARTANEAVSLGATYIVYGYLGGSAAKPVLHQFIEDATEHKLVVQGTSEGSPWLNNLSGIASSVHALIRPTGKLGAYEFHNEQSARLFAAGLKSKGPEAVSRFEAAAAADPACGWCWLAWVEQAASGGPPEALRVLARSREQGNEISALSRARLDALEASLRNDSPARRGALERIAQEAPSDVASLAQLAELRVLDRNFDQAAGLLHRALDTEPGRGDLWNSLAYAQAYAGRFDEATRSAAEYAKLDQSANPLDSQGEIALLAGRFSEAASLLTASYERDRNFNSGAALEKAAMAQWLGGKRQESGELLQRYLTDRRHAGDPLADLTQARWEYLFGQTAEAKRRLRELSEEATNPVAPLAAAVYAVHAAADGQFDEARQAARIARARARTPIQNLFASMAQAAAENGDPAANIADPSLKAEARALALTVRGQWPAAAEAWREVLKQPRGMSDSAQRELLALCLTQSGKASEAAPLISRAWPLLTREQSLLYDFLIFPNLFYVRAEVAVSQKKSAEAQRQYDLFLQYSGDRPDPFGRLARARNAARL